MTRLRLIRVLALVLSAVGASPLAARPGQPVIMPFLYEDARLYVPVRIASGPVHWFILDTGASHTVIDTALAKSSGLGLSAGRAVTGAGAGSSQEARTAAVHLSVGGVPLRVAQPTVIDLVHLLGATSGRAPAGIIGSEFFREHFVDVNFAAHRISIYAAASERRSFYAAEVPLTFADRTPLTQVQLTVPSGRLITAIALVDLGAKSTFLVPEPFIDREKLREAFPNKIESPLGAGVGGDTFYAFARARRLGFAGAGLALERPVIGLSIRGSLRATWHEGLLGADFLSRFRLGFDYMHARLLLTQRSNESVAFDRSGLFLVAQGSDLSRVVVRSLVDGSPAARAGLAPGDELLTIDGVPVGAIGLSAIRDRLKQPGTVQVTLGFRRGGERRAARFGLRDLI
jgi:hypothetical protein